LTKKTANTVKERKRPKNGSKAVNNTAKDNPLNIVSSVLPVFRSYKSFFPERLFGWGKYWKTSLKLVQVIGKQIVLYYLKNVLKSFLWIFYIENGLYDQPLAVKDFHYEFLVCVKRVTFPGCLNS
jgi:hypothetical protein